MSDYVFDLCNRNRRRGVLVDTSLLLLVVVGNYSLQRVLTFDRLRKYTLDDYVLIKKLMSYFERRVTTPNILTEVVDFARQLHEREHEAVSFSIAQLIREQFEIYVPSTVIAQDELFARVGLTDCATIASSDEALVVTDDFELEGRITSMGRDAININHIRFSDWISNRP
jgi:hypothetical protein